MAERGLDAGERPGCVLGWLLGTLARLVLVYPVISIASRLGQAGQRAAFTVPGTPYEGALAGGVVGAVIGLSLWWCAIRGEGWRARLCEVALTGMTVAWLAGVFGEITGRATTADLIGPWALCTVGAIVVVLLART